MVQDIRENRMEHKEILGCAFLK